MKNLAKVFFEDASYKPKADDKKILAMTHPYFYFLYLSEVVNCKKFQKKILEDINKMDFRDDNYFKDIFLSLCHFSLGNPSEAKKYKMQAMQGIKFNYIHSSEPWCNILTTLRYFISLSLKISKKQTYEIMDHIKKSNLFDSESFRTFLEILNLLDITSEEENEIIETIAEKFSPNFMQIDHLRQILSFSSFPGPLFKKIIDHLKVETSCFKYYSYFEYYINDLKFIKLYFIENKDHESFGYFIEKIDGIKENMSFEDARKLFKLFVSHKVLDLFPKFNRYFKNRVNENPELPLEKKQKYLFWCAQNASKDHHQNDAVAFSENRINKRPDQ